MALYEQNQKVLDQNKVLTERVDFLVKELSIQKEARELKQNGCFQG
jgi:hypothetical protein